MIKNKLTMILSIAVITALTAVSLFDVRKGFGYGGGGGGSSQPSATITLSSPNGGELWGAGTTHSIDWTTTGGTLISNVKVEYSTDGGNNYSTLTENTPNTGTFSWSIAEGVDSSRVRVRVKGLNTGGGLMATDTSDNNFTITQNVVKPEAPTNIKVDNPGTGTSLEISWVNPSSNFHHIKIYRSTEEGVLGSMIKDNLTGTTYTDTGLENEKMYYYTLRSVSELGVESDNTDQHSGKPSITTASKEKSYLTVDKTSAIADGNSAIEATIGARDANNNPLVGVELTLLSNRSEDQMATISGENKTVAVSDSNGEAKFIIKSMTAGISVLSAKVDGVIIDQTQQIEFTPTAQPSSNIAEYAYSVVSQSANPSINQGGQTTVYLEVKNTGTATWYSTGAYPVRLGTDRPSDRNSGFYTASDKWLSTNRIAMEKGIVTPGETVKFSFLITGTPGAGTYPEYFRPVVEHLGWLSDNGIKWDINVKEVKYTYAWVSQSSYPTIKKGESATLTLRIKNTGNTTWSGDGAFPIHLGTDRPMDRSSVIWHPDWISSNRAAVMNELSVEPGQEATFNISVYGTNTGTFREYFRPLAENLTWMNDAGIYWDITVTE